MKKEENKIYNKPAYKCGICGNEYGSVRERMNCEMACLKKQQEEEKRAAAEKKKAEQTARKTEVNEALKNFAKLVKAYVKDYGHYDYNYDEEVTRDLFYPNKLFHHFWF